MAHRSRTDVYHAGTASAQRDALRCRQPEASGNLVLFEYVATASTLLLHHVLSARQYWRFSVLQSVLQRPHRTCHRGSGGQRQRSRSENDSRFSWAPSCASCADITAE